MPCRAAFTGAPGVPRARPQLLWWRRPCGRRLLDAPARWFSSRRRPPASLGFGPLALARRAKARPLRLPPARSALFRGAGPGRVSASLVSLRGGRGRSLPGFRCRWLRCPFGFRPGPPFALRRAVFCACWSGVLPCLPPAPAAPAGGSRGAQGCAFGCFCLVLLAAIRRGVFCFRAFALCAGGATFQGAGCSAPLTFANTCVSMIWQGCAAPIWGPLREGCPGCSKTRLDLIQAGFFVPAFRLLRSSAFHFSPI